mgnify:CR=1 FL=1
MIQKDDATIPLVYSEPRSSSTTSYTQVTYETYVRPHKKKLCSACCTFTFLSTFLLMFFLLPRSPEMWLKSYTPLSLNSTSSPISATWTETFGFKNSNWYTMNWSDLKIDVYFCDQPSLWQCSWETTLPLIFEGSYVNPSTSSDEFTTSSRSSTNVELAYTSTASPSTLAYMAATCASQGYIILWSQASVEGELKNGRSFGTTYLNGAVLVDCS